MSQVRRTLLINPPIVDLRIAWAEWVEPTGLLKVGALLRSEGVDVRLLDCFRGNPKHRERDAIIERQGQPLSRWRFGLSAFAITTQLRAYKKEGWVPDEVHITTLTSFWWLGVPFVVPLVRRVFPAARIVLGGKYPEEAPEHAIEHSGADVVVAGDVTSSAITYPSLPDLYLGRLQSYAVTDLQDVGLRKSMRAIGLATSKGVTRLHLADHGIASRDPARLRRFLERLAQTHPRTRLYILGELSPMELARRTWLADALRSARCRQLVLADNRDYPLGSRGADAFLEHVTQATKAAQAAGFRVGTDDYAVQVSVGRPGEKPEQVAALVARLAHVAGSVIPVPFQSSTVHLGVSDPWETNGKLFPWAERNDVPFSDYMELLGLCSIVNAKYRSRTFDFLSQDSLIANSLRRSLRAEAWKPSVGQSERDLPPIGSVEHEVA